MAATFTTTSTRTFQTSLDAGGIAILDNTPYGIVFNGMNSTNGVQPTTNNAASSDAGAFLTGGFYFETPAVDEVEDVWIKNGQHASETGTKFDWDDIWLFAHLEQGSISDFNSGNEGQANLSTSLSSGNWRQMNVLNRSFIITSGSSSDPLTTIAATVNFYGLEKATTPTGTPSAEGATLIGSSDINVTYGTVGP
jgi:hypothetical protein